MNSSDDMVLRRADYDLSREQQALRDAFENLLQHQCPSERVRESEPLGFDPKLWQQLVDVRFVAMGVPEHAAGDGAGLVELVLVAEQLGRYLAPVPFAETAASARLLAAIGSDEATRSLDRVMAGAQLITLALHAVRAGERQLVPAGAVADAVLGLHDDELVLVTRDRPQPAVANQGSAPLAWWDLTAHGGTRTVLASGAPARAHYDQARQEWRLLMASAQVGLSEGAHRIAVDFAKERVAFGVPIGTFQAVAHPLVDVAIAVTAARRLVARAAWFSDHEPGDAPALVAMAFLHATRTAMRSTSVGVHVLGGLGFTVESDQQLYFRRAKGWALVAGDPNAELSRIADGLFGVSSV